MSSANTPSTDLVEPAPAAAGPYHQHHWWPRLSYAGLAVGTLAFGASLTPSLLPRPWLFEGVIAGIGFALGYGVGVLIAYLLRTVRVREPKPRFKHWAWRVLHVVGPLLAIYWLLLGVGWQNEVRTLVGMPDEGLATAVEVAAVAIPTAVVAILFGRLLRLFNLWLVRPIDRVLPRPVAGVLAVVIIAALTYLVVTGVIFRGFVAAMNSLYAGTNASTSAGATQPKDPESSGSPASFVSWDSLGMEGRNFVSRGPSVAQLTEFNHTLAKVPIRVYVGLDSAPDAASRAALAVKELERTGAFDRTLLVVAGTTGTGWIEPQTRNTIEYQWNGDDAIVGIQYSYLPSWISTLADADKASAAGAAIYNAVYDHWKELPVDHRPILMAYGLSLGSFSIQSAFTSSRDLTARTEGAVLVGSPNFSQPWGQISADRQPGSICACISDGSPGGNADRESDSVADCAHGNDDLRCEGAADRQSTRPVDRSASRACPPTCRSSKARGGHRGSPTSSTPTIRSCGGARTSSLPSPTGSGSLRARAAHPRCSGIPCSRSCR